MKEFILYKFYMGLLTIVQYLLLLILFIIFLIMLPTMLINSVTMLISLAVIVIGLAFGLIYLTKIKGKIGEYITQKVIESYCNKRGYAYLYDVMVKNDNQDVTTSQIDHLIITRRGIAVIETKFHSGTIYGSEYDKDWTYITRDNDNRKHKHSYHNPLRQNYGHIEALKKIVDRDVEYYNMVLFIDTVNFAKCEAKNKFSKVGYTYDLNNILENFDSLSEKKISSTESFEIYNKIKGVNITDKESRVQHIEEINKIKT